MPQPLNILHMHSSFDLGGKEARAVRLMNAFGDRARHTIVSGVPGALSARDAIAKGIAYEIAQNPPPLTGRPSVARFEAIAKYMRRFDLVLSYNWGGIDAVMAKRAFPKGAPPVIHHEDGFNADEAVRLKARRTVYRRLAFGAAHAVVVPSVTLEHLAKTVWKIGPPLLHRISNGIQTSLYAQQPDPKAIPGFVRKPGEVVVGALAGLREVKNLPALVRAVAGCPSKIRLVIVGEGPEREKILQTAANMAMTDQLVMPGFLPDPHRYVGLFDIMSLSSMSEQFPISIVEGMAAGLPIAATNAGDMLHMVSRENWPLIDEHRNEVGLRDVIQAAAANPAGRAAVGKANRAKAVAEYDEKTMIAAYRTLYKAASIGRGATLSSYLLARASIRYIRALLFQEIYVFKGLKPIIYNGQEVWPLVEGGKGVAATNHASAGAWAAAGGIGTVSAVNADSYDPEGKIIPQIYTALTRRERHEELIRYAIDGAVEQVKRAYDIAGGKGAININVLWEMGGAQRILHGVLERTRGLVSGVTCGAGMPYKLSEITASYNVSYLPIISSARAFSALWKRAYSKAAEWLSAVVYEDPWLAGGHNGLSNAEDPLQPQDPYPRVKALRETMREGGIPDSVPIVMAGGVWYLRDWDNWIDNPELGSIAFQFGTRPLLTQESPIPEGWKAKLTDIEPGEVLLHRFSPTGFYFSAVRNPFLRALEAQSDRQIAFSTQEAGDHTFQLDVGVKGKNFWVTRNDLLRAREWFGHGFTDALKTPDNTLVFVTPEEKAIIRKDQADCMGCLSQCAFSSWKDSETNSTGRLADPRSFCIQKTLQDIAHGGDIDQNLMFAGHGAYNFKKDPFYSNGFVPTVKQLVDRILTGD